MFLDSPKALRVYACCISAVSRFYCTFEGIFLKPVLSMFDLSTSFVQLLVLMTHLLTAMAR